MATDLQVEGELPKELNGRYLRNGPNPLIWRLDRTTTGLSVLAWFGAFACGRQGEGTAIVMLPESWSNLRGQPDMLGQTGMTDGGLNTNVGTFAQTWAMVEAEHSR